MERLRLRLDILKDSDVIDEDVYRKLINLILRLKEKWGISITEDNGAMFITHIAMALQKMKRGEAVSRIDEGVYSEVLESGRLKEIEKIYQDMEAGVFQEKLDEEEKKYILVNLLLILEE